MHAKSKVLILTTMACFGVLSAVPYPGMGEQVRGKNRKRSASVRDGATRRPSVNMTPFNPHAGIASFPEQVPNERPFGSASLKVITQPDHEGEDIAKWLSSRNIPQNPERIAFFTHKYRGDLSHVKGWHGTLIHSERGPDGLIVTLRVGANLEMAVESSYQDERYAIDNGNVVYLGAVKNSGPGSYLLMY